MPGFWNMKRHEAIEIVQKIRAAAELALADGSGVIALALTRETAPTAERIRLTGHGGPIGDVLNAKPDVQGRGWHVVGRFQCAAVIRWATKSINELSRVA